MEGENVARQCERSVCVQMTRFGFPRKCVKKKKSTGSVTTCKVKYCICSIHLFIQLILKTVSFGVFLFFSDESAGDSLQGGDSI